LDQIDVSTTAIVLDEEFGRYVTGFNPNKNGSITMTSYSPNKIVYKTNANSEQFAVFSEVWYGPNKGWKVKLNGDNVSHVRANYLLRAMKVPAGENTIEFYFEPDAFYRGEKISMASSSILIVLVLGAIAWAIMKRRKEDEIATETEEN
jgi:uncharacterized membrane protein YfhO